MNEEKVLAFKELHSLFDEHGFKLYFVGGTVRDYLLNLPLSDLDVVTDATPIEMKHFLVDADYTFEKYGSVRLKYKGFKFDVTSMRKENSYIDFRHPGEITFCTSLEEDVKRRDFTINGLYMDENLKVIDYVEGCLDLKKHVIRMIGNPDTRIKEDPLRIFRAVRFMVDFDFILDNDLESSIKANSDLVKNLRKEKIEQELGKCVDKEKMLEKLKYLNISW